MSKRATKGDDGSLRGCGEEAKGLGRYYAKEERSFVSFSAMPKDSLRRADEECEMGSESWSTHAGLSLVELEAWSGNDNCSQLCSEVGGRRRRRRSGWSGFRLAIIGCGSEVWSVRGGAVGAAVIIPTVITGHETAE
jgi:hypothetical protein